eukprot:1005237-Prymnesium_polylepis.1
MSRKPFCAPFLAALETVRHRRHEAHIRLIFGGSRWRRDSAIACDNGVCAGESSLVRVLKACGKRVRRGAGPSLRARARTMSIAAQPRVARQGMREPMRGRARLRPTIGVRVSSGARAERTRCSLTLLCPAVRQQSGEARREVGVAISPTLGHRGTCVSRRERGIGVCHCSASAPLTRSACC